MHTAFQEIISKFLKSTTLLLSKGAEPSNRPSECHVQKSLTSYDNHLGLYKSLISYLDSECLLLTNNIESGQITCEERICEITKKIRQLEKFSDEISGLIKHLNDELSLLVAQRDFLNLKSPTLQEFNHFSGSIEFNVFFLNNDFTNDFTGCEQFKRLSIDKNSFLDLDQVYQTSSSPQVFLEGIYSFLGLSPDKKVALCNYQPRHNGFLIYFSPLDSHITQVFESISQKDPLSTYKLKESNAWIVDTTIYDFETRELLDCFDVWVDTNWLTIYLKESLFPIHETKKPIIKPSTNHPCYLGSFFNLLNSKLQINRITLLGAINQVNPYWFVQKVSVLNELRFNEVNDFPHECLHDLLLIKFSNGENEQYIAYYSPLENRIILSTNADNTEAEILINVYKLGLAILSNTSFTESQNCD